MIKLSEDQQLAVDMVMDWRATWEGSGRQEFKIGGLAGSGKSTIISVIGETLSRTTVMAPTGKAVESLARKGIKASTIHSMIYNSYKTRSGYAYKRKRSVEGATFIIDEASMVSSREYQNLLAFNKPILWVGDHGQLEPIGENPMLMRHPDIKLEKIHRQQAGNPILKLAMAFRENREEQVPQDWRDPEGRLIVTSRDRFEELKGDRQIIVSKNATRATMNASARSGMRTGMGNPQPGEPIICLQNNYRYQVFNGQQAVIESVSSRDEGIIEIEMRLDDGRIIMAPCAAECFGAVKVERNEIEKDILMFDYAYALTAHKTQGSEFDHAIVYEERLAAVDMCRLRYTAVTRARQSLVYCWKKP